VDLPIPSNDDAIRAIRLVTSRIADAALEGNRIREAAMIEVTGDGAEDSEASEEEQEEAAAIAAVAADVTAVAAAAFLGSEADAETPAPAAETVAAPAQ